MPRTTTGSTTRRLAVADPLARVDLAELRRFVRDKRYFILHAPRQTGKTSVLLAFQDLLNGPAGGGYCCCGPDGALQKLIVRWSLHSAKPLVLLIDEVDALVGDTLLSVLRQLRAGYDQRPAGYPRRASSCAACGTSATTASVPRPPRNPLPVVAPSTSRPSPCA